MATNLSYAGLQNFRDSVMKAKSKGLIQLYDQWAAEIAKRVEMFGRRRVPSDELSEMELRSLMRSLDAAQDAVNREVSHMVIDGMTEVGKAAVDSQIKFAERLGFTNPKMAAFISIPRDVTTALVNGDVYSGGWSLSKAIWGYSDALHGTLYQIVAGGLNQGKTMYQIAKDLEMYVSPSKRRPWNLTDKDGRKIYPKQVDYNAQRLARTLIQHSFQLSFVNAMKVNPFIEKVIWIANGSRACNFCLDMDGQIFDVNNVPLDHPNGMCITEPIVDMDDVMQQLADWVVADEGTYPEIDEFAELFEDTPKDD